MKRTFIALKIPLSKETSESINQIKSELKGERIRWVDSENFHITLFFLGDTDENQIQLISEKLSNELKGFQSFDIAVKGIGLFKNVHNPRTFWLGIDHSEQLNTLKIKVDLVLDNFNFKIENRRFSPHLTLGRMKFIKNKNKLKEILDNFKITNFHKVKIEEVLFYESVLSAKGPSYYVLEKFRLD